MELSVRTYIQLIWLFASLFFCLSAILDSEIDKLTSNYTQTLVGVSVAGNPLSYDEVLKFAPQDCEDTDYLWVKMISFPKKEIKYTNAAKSKIPF